MSYGNQKLASFNWNHIVFSCYAWKNDILRKKSVLAHAEQLLPQIHLMFLFFPSFSIESKEKSIVPKGLMIFSVILTYYNALLSKVTKELHLSSNLEWNHQLRCSLVVFFLTSHCTRVSRYMSMYSVPLYSRHEICPKFWTAGLSGQNFYTVNFT